MLSALACHRAFIIYRASDKSPIDPTHAHPDTSWANSNAQDRATWLLPHEAEAYVAMLGAGYGIGLVLHPELKIFCVDIDGAWDGVEWSALAKAFFVRFAGCAIEVSMSGRGAHIFGRYTGEMPAHKTKNTALHIELYHELRYIALTGNGLVGDITHDCTATLSAFAAQYFTQTDDDAVPGEWRTGPMPSYGGPSDDATLLDRALKSKSMAAVFGGGVSFADLWTGNAHKLASKWPPNPTNGGQYDESSADQALANHLAFWTGNDCERMLRLMGESALKRDKWEQRADYLPRTILRACSWQKTFAGATGSGKAVPAPQPVALQAPPPPRAQDAPPPPAPIAPPPPPASGAAGVSVPPIPNGMPVIRPETGKGNLITAAGQLELFAGYTYIQDLHQVMTPSGFTLDQKRFDVAKGGRMFIVTPTGERPTDSAWEAFTKSQIAEFPKVRGMYFEPRKEPGAIMEREGQLWINSWAPIEIRMVPGDVSRFLRHLQILFPADWRILLNYLKFMMQRKGEKSMWWPFLQGVPGNGKSFISETMEYCIGLKYTQKPTPKNLDSQFNASLYGCLFLAFEDVKVRDDFGAMWETLKPMVTGTRLEIQPKGVDKVTREVCFNAIMNSNHKNGIRKEADDRRIAPLFAAQQHRWQLERDGLTKAYFIDLWDWAKGGTQDGWAHIAYYLATDPIDADAQFIEAPITSCTAEHISLSLGGAEQEILEAVRSNSPGFCGGWVSSVKMDQTLAASGRARAIPRAQRPGILEALGYIPHPALPDGRVTTPLSDGTRPVLYVTQDHTTLSLTDANAVRAAYELAQRAK
jgi:Family of unknown function (DUF5906)